MRSAGLRSKVQREPSDLSPSAENLLCETQSRARGEPVGDKPAPEQDHPLAVLAETRDTEAATVAANDRLPAENILILEVSPEVGDALLLDFLQIAESETAFQHLVFLQVVVDRVPGDDASLLVIV